MWLKLMVTTFDQIADAFKQAKRMQRKTNSDHYEEIKGKVYPFMENQVSWHGSAPNDEQCKQALEELEKGGRVRWQK